MKKAKMRQRLISFDWAIKKILRNKANFDILEGFLSELIAPNKDIKIVKILESEGNKTSAFNKANHVDILAEIDPGDIVIIEIQVDCELDFLHRILFGAAKVITEYLATSQAYAKIKKVYSINIVYFELGHGSDYIYKGTTDFVGMHNQEILQLSNRQKESYQKELISDIYPEYYLIKVNNFDDLAENTLDEWIYFLKNEEIKPGFHAKGLLKAKAELDVLKLSAEERAEYDRYQDEQHYQASMRETRYIEGKYEGREEGRDEGREEGEKAKAVEIARSMLQADFAIHDIAKFTKLSITEIASLVK